MDLLARFFRHESCSKKHSAALDRIETLERQVKQFARDVADCEDYINKLSARVLKRLDRAKPAEEAVPENGMDAISAAIHARRNRRVI